MQTHLFCFLASYWVALLLEVARVRRNISGLRWAALGFTIAGATAQIWYLLARSRAAQLPPLLASTHDWLLVSALLLVAVYLIYTLTGFRRAGSQSLGLFVLPVGVAMVTAASFVRNSPNRLLETERFWKMLHASSLAIGITGVLIGFLLSLMYLMQHRRLKRKQQLQGGFQLPPLTSLARYNRWMIVGSVPMLTLGMLTGFKLIFQANRANAPIAWTDPIVIGFLVLWVGMVSLFLWLFRSDTMPGRQVALLTVWACGFLIVTLVGLQVLVSVTGIPSQHGGKPVSSLERRADIPHIVSGRLFLSADEETLP